MTMDTTMELDELKQAWRTLGRQLERHDAIQLRLYRDSKLDKARSSLRPLVFGQLMQLLFGLPFLLLAVALWTRAGASSLPLPWTTLAAGIFVHAYGLATVVLAGLTLGLIGTVNYSAPVVVIQKQLARLRRFYIFNGMIVGLPWWLMWVPVLMVLGGLGDVDLYARAPSMVWTGLGIGVAGLLGTWWFHRWSRQPARLRLGKRLDESCTGGSIRKAQALLEEIAEFERE